MAGGIDLTGCWVMPGLIDGHVHLGGTGVPGCDEAEHTEPVRAVPRVADQFEHGATTVADLFGYPPTMLTLRVPIITSALVTARGSAGLFG
ncbi:MAG: hypothetical protein ACM3JP_01330 [Betaproteobacteria bacterium]